VKHQSLDDLMPEFIGMFHKSTSVFFNLFLEVEPFAVILIAYRTHGRSEKFVYGEIMKFEAELVESGKRFLESGQQTRGSGGKLKAPSVGFGAEPLPFGCTKSPENVSFSSHFSIGFGRILLCHWRNP